MADIRPGWSNYQRSLSGVERSWHKAVNKEYRQIRGDLAGVLDRYGTSQVARSQVKDVYMGLKSRAERVAMSQVPDIIQAGEKYTAQQVVFLKKHNIIKLRTLPVMEHSLGLVLAQELANMDWVDASLAFMLSDMSKLKLAGETEDLIKLLLSVKLIDGRATPYRKAGNALRHSVVMKTWGSGSNVLAHLYGMIEDNTDQAFMRQAISAVDEVTTDCCLNVHGQIVGFKEKFHLVGTPRFRDRMKNPPFHDYCRTATSLYQDRMDAIPGAVTTQQMRDASQAELKARKDGSREEVHPAHATSKRP